MSSYNNGLYTNNQDFYSLALKQLADNKAPLIVTINGQEKSSVDENISDVITFCVPNYVEWLYHD